MHELDNDFQIEESELEIGNRIGVGSFGEVFKGTWRGTDVAIKRFMEQDISPQILNVKILLTMMLTRNF